ncbi:MAG: autotransporter domain-containing protein, partial [Pseudorhodoplanes sp.]
FGSPFGGGTDTATAGNARIIVDGAIQNLGFPASVVFNAFTTAGNATIDVRNRAFVDFYDNSTGGNARFITDANLLTYVDFSQTLGLLGNGVVTAGSIEGGGVFYIGSNNLIVGSNNLSTTVTGIIDVCSCGTLTKVGSGTLTLNLDPSWTFTFSGSLVVDGGTVVVNSDLSQAYQAVANSGGTLAGGSLIPGAAILPTTFINAGGTLSPGNGTTGDIAQLGVFGPLQFASGSTYAVDVAPTGAPGIPFPTSADFTLVLGQAALAGTLRATGIGGTGYTVGTIYPVLGAFGGLNGSRFDKLFIAGSFGSTRPVITYDDPAVDTVFLQLIQGEVSSQLTPAATVNQRAVAAGLDNALKNGADFGVFTPLYNLGGDSFLKALDQLSGEANTGIFQSVYQSVSNFIGSMLNPFNNSRGIFGPATPYAAESDDPEADAYAQKRRVSKQAQQAMAAAMPVKAMPVRDNRYAVWASGYGGQTSMDANSVVGSHQTSVRGYGFTTGLDFRVAPEALVGFAMAGGNSSWGLSEGLGGGKTDNFHVGAYGSLRYGPAYLSAAMAYGRHWVSTKRNVAVPGFATLESDYDANSFGGRVEAGYRYGLGSFGVTPYAALQATVVRLPGYAENATGGSNAFALQYGRQNDSLFRTELGSWFDHSRVIPGGLMTLRARAAWAHDEGADRALTGTFPVLPGSTFLVQGTSPGNNFALLSAGAEWKYWNGMSFAARFDTELSDSSRGFGGTGVFRYVW